MCGVHIFVYVCMCGVCMMCVCICVVYIWYVYVCGVFVCMCTHVLLRIEPWAQATEFSPLPSFIVKTYMLQWKFLHLLNHIYNQTVSAHTLEQMCALRAVASATQVLF